MTVPTSEAAQANDSGVAAVDAPEASVARELQLEGDRERGRKIGYSILIRGDVQSSSTLSSSDPDETITLFENNTKLLSGSLRGETAGFVLEGEIVAAEFDEPTPTIKLDGRIVDPKRWSTVKKYVGYGPDQEPVEDPFPDCGGLGKPLGDPLDPKEHVVSLTADEPGEIRAYCFDVDGAVVDRPDSATISDDGERVYGYLTPGASAEITIRGVVTRIDTAAGVDLSVRDATERTRSPDVSA